MVDNPLFVLEPVEEDYVSDDTAVSHNVGDDEVFPALIEPVNQSHVNAMAWNNILKGAHSNQASVPMDDVKGWSGLFKDERTMGNLQYFPPKKEGGQTFIYPPDDIVEEGISKWRSSLVANSWISPCPISW